MWSVYYQMSDLRAEIKRDLTRLFVDGAPTEDHFFTPPRQHLLLTVLYLWSRLHYPTPSYRQGMHELLAPILFALEADAAALRAASVEEATATGAATGTAASEAGATKELLELCPDWESCDSALEADCFAMFEALMNEMEPW